MSIRLKRLQWGIVLNLANCPRCHSDNVLVDTDIISGFVECLDCNHITRGLSEHDAIIIWNKESDVWEIYGNQHVKKAKFLEAE